LDQILEQVLKTNGRVTGLEKGTSVWCFFQDRPKLAILTLLGILFLSQLGIAELVKLLL